MRIIKMSDMQEFALEAVVYGCNTNKRLSGASYLKDIHSEHPRTISFYTALEVVDEMMGEPAADVVEVVRCKDCKYLNAEYKCVNWRGLYDYTKADDFCSYGERRDDV